MRTQILLASVVALVGCGGTTGADASLSNDVGSLTDAPVVLGDGATAVALCGLTNTPGDTACAAAPVQLSTELCRCGSHYYFDGTTCVATAACQCYAGCEWMFGTMEACTAAYASCR